MNVQALSSAVVAVPPASRQRSRHCIAHARRSRDMLTAPGGAAAVAEVEVAVVKVVTSVSAPAVAPPSQPASSPPDPPPPRTLGAFLVELALNKASKARKQATKAKKEEGAEDAHPNGAAASLQQSETDEAVRLLRLALRRLRNALWLAGTHGVRLPFRPKALSPTLKALGTPRDAEAMAATLQKAAESAANSSQLSADEAEAVAFALHVLSSQRAGHLADAAAAAGSPRVTSLLSRLDASLGGDEAAPLAAFSGLAARPAPSAGPAALRLVAADTLAHPGWDLLSLSPDTLAPLSAPTDTDADTAGNGGGGKAGAAGGAKRGGGRARRARSAAVRAAAASSEPPAPAPAPAWAVALGVDPAKCVAIHDLRKACRELRYALEASAPLFESSASPPSRAKALEDAISLLSDVAKAIGDMHDVEVCLAAADPALPRLVALPGLRASLGALHGASWRLYKAARAKLLSPEGQAKLFAALAPLGLEGEGGDAVDAAPAAAGGGG